VRLYGIKFDCRRSGPRAAPARRSRDALNCARDHGIAVRATGRVPTISVPAPTNSNETHVVSRFLGVRAPRLLLSGRRFRRNRMAAKKPEKKAEKKAEKKPEKKPGEQPAMDAPAGKGSVWGLPLAMVMLAIAAGGFWFAMRESSNRTEAATVAAVMTPDGETKAPKTEPRASAPAAAASPSATKTETVPASAVKPVSITGCLQKNDRGFLLRDTEGADAPKSRSWKSGFLKRSSSSVVLNDAAGAHLADHVGQRVSVTGPLVDRQMRVTSLRRVSAACE
jgi:hypothetical protein